MKLFGKKNNVKKSAALVSMSISMMEGLESRALLSGSLVTSCKLGMSSTAIKLGEPVTLAARVGKVAPDTTTPTGRAAFYIGGVLIGSKKINSLGVARFTIPTLFNGTYSMKTIYLGDTTHAGHRSPERSLSVTTPTLTTSGTGLQYATVVPGSGSATLTNGSSTDGVKYTGYLTNGSIFDSGILTNFTVGQFVPGFNEGLIGMKVGETRLLVIPGNLGYGANPPSGSGIPANATLVFVVTVTSIT